MPPAYANGGIQRRACACGGAKGRGSFWEAMWALVVCSVATCVVSVWMLYARKVWDPRGKVRGCVRLTVQRVLVTGGSQGLGLALAQRLAARGAHVVICSRTPGKLEAALREVEGARVDAAQELRYVAADVSTFAGAQQALAACGAVPDTVFCCAGGAKPGYFVEQEEADFEAAVRTDYFTALSMAHVRARLTQASARAMRAQGVAGRIVLVSSVVGMMGLVGYAQYAPMKYAIRGTCAADAGLAETLRSEFQLYGLQVHCYCPATILSPGYDEEQKTKPQVTKDLEEGDEHKTPAQCAAHLLRGVERGRFLITDGLVGSLLRVTTSGSAPGHGVLVDAVLAVPARVRGVLADAGVVARLAAVGRGPDGGASRARGCRGCRGCGARRQVGGRRQSESVAVARPGAGVSGAWAACGAAPRGGCAAGAARGGTPVGARVPRGAAARLAGAGHPGLRVRFRSRVGHDGL